MDAILNYKPDKKDNFYAVVGCDELSSTEQIICEYKTKALECHPDKHPDNPDAAEQFAVLQQAKEVLCDPEKRAMYDGWRRSGIAIPYNEWVAKKDSIHTSLHWASHKKKEPMLEEGPSTKVQDEIPNLSEDDSWLDAHWQRASGDDMLKKFRNYDI